MKPEKGTEKLQEFAKGSPCLAAPNGHWRPAHIHTVNADGTFNIELDRLVQLVEVYQGEISKNGIAEVDKDGSSDNGWKIKEEIKEPSNWFGVTNAEISFDDDQMWPAIFAQICPNGRSFSRNTFREALKILGYQDDPGLIRKLWDQGCRMLFKVSEKEAEKMVLNEENAYRFFLYHGFSAKQLALDLKPGRNEPFFKKYFNQIRMGGREPSEISRNVTLEDAFVTLGVTSGEVNETATAFLQQFELANAIHLPTSLVKLLKQTGIAYAISNCHPLWPCIVEITEWCLRRNMRKKNLSGDFALDIMYPYEGDFNWSVVFDEGEEDARVYYVEGKGMYEDESWQLTAPGIGMFFWDLAQSGLAWYQDTQFMGGKKVKRNDIGLILDL
jgi:hypothetical protein